MATIERIRTLVHHTCVAALAPRQPCQARATRLHHGPLINPPKQELGSMPRNGPNLGKNYPCHPYRAAPWPLLFVQCALPLGEP